MVLDQHRLNRERLLAIHRERGYERVQSLHQLSIVGSRGLDEAIFHIGSHLGVLSIDDRWQRQHYAIGVGDHWVDW